MGPDADYQPLQPNGNGKQPYQSMPFYTADSSEFDEDKFDLHQILAVARRRFIIIAGVAIAVASGIASNVLKQVPTYEGRFQLLIGPVSGEDKVDQLTKSLSKELDAQVQGPDYETQMQVLWSPQVLSPIAKTIQARYPEVDYDTLRGKLAISRLNETKILEVRYQDTDPDKIQFVLEQVAQGYITYSKNEQRSAIKQGLEFVNKQSEALSQRVNKLQGDLEKFRKDYQIIDPETQGQLLTNRISEIKKQREEAQAQLVETEQLYSGLQSQLNQLGVEPEQAITASALSESPRYQQLLNQLAEINAKIARESARLKDEDPMMQKLLEERDRLQPLVEQEATTVVGNRASGVPDNPEFLASPNSIRSDLTKQLVEATNRRQVLQERIQITAKVEAQLAQQLRDWPSIARYYTALQQQLNTATESLSRFLAVQETLQIENAQKTNSWQTISQIKKPELPISPNVPRGILLGAIAGLVAGAGAALLAEKVDRVFHSPDELKDSSGLPVLGTIPYTKDIKKLIASTIAGSMPDEKNPGYPLPGGGRGYNASPFLEAFRSLYTNLEFLSPDQPIRSLVISSSTPADGKSTINMFLAHAAAAMGLRVLLVDADLRRPRIHSIVDLPNVWGLSNVISSEINVDDVIQRSPLENNLYVLTAGQLPPDPTRLLASKKMGTLVERFQEAFDLVIFDTPPLLGLADARILAAHTDGIALVVGLGKTDRSVLAQVLYGLRTSRARILGVIANGVKGYTTSSYNDYLKYYSRTPQEQEQAIGGERRG